MDDVPTVAFAKRAEIYRLLRYMMFENPIDAEQLAVEVNAPELKKVDWTGSGAIGFSNPNGKTDYIVYNRGTKYTTPVRPSHFSDSQIIYVSRPAASTLLWPRLQESCRILEELSSDVYATFGIKKILDSVGYFYSPRSTPQERPLARYSEALANLGEPSKLPNNDAIRNWVGKCWSQLIELYGSCLLAGDEVRYALTTFALFELCPFPLTSLFEMNLRWLQQNFGITLGDKPVGMAFPDVNIRFYLEHHIVRPDLAVVWGTSTARVLQKHAEQSRDEAKLKLSVEQFHSNLYLALLYYRCALYAYNVVLSLSKSNLVTGERALQRIEEARTEVALCEEHRVIIMASLSAAVLGLTIPNIANVEEFQNWVASWAKYSSRKAELKIRQAYDAELLMPKFLRDVALGLIACISSETKAGLAKMLSAMQELEKHIEEAVLLGDPNYLSTTYGLMAGICAKNGMESQRPEYSRRAEPAYYKKLANLK
ncbi:MAG TPA: hypothetical protein VGJ30_12675 [Candidatus Angelobacter sp.]